MTDFIDEMLTPEEDPNAKVTDPILIRRVREPYGWMGNMSAHPVEHKGVQWRTTEALFQALRFEDPDIREAIRAQTGPMQAKVVAHEHGDKMTVEPRSDEDLDNMRLCIHLKLEQHPHLKEDLRVTGQRLILEDCTKRPTGSGPFWGAVGQGDGTWVGHNWLGRLWMEAREML